MTPGKEAIAGAAEPLPDRFLLAARDAPDRLPLGLKRFDLLCGLNPIGRSAQPPSALAYRTLPGEVSGPPLRLGRKMGFAAPPPPVVRRFNPPPQRFALGARHV